MFLVVGPRGVRGYQSLEDAVREAESDDYIVACVDGRPVALKLIPTTVSTATPRQAETTETLRSGPGEGIAERARPEEGVVVTGGEGYRVAAVFDQMFRGFADIAARYVDSVELHEIVGRGLDKPRRRGRITMWPARDDFDVLQVVQTLAAQGKKVVFFTGDKKLARQAESLSDPMIRVEYMPPNEYPGKESLANAMIKALKEEVERAG